MLTPDRLGPIENAIRNIAFLLMAGMMQAMSSLMGDLSQTLHDAFGGDQKRDVAAEVREHMSSEQSKMLDEIIAEAKPDSAIEARLIAKLDDETADHLLQVITAEDYGLPPLTQQLEPPALLAYFQLLQDGREPLVSSVQEFSGTLEALTRAQNRVELQQDLEGRLSSLVGEPVKVEIDKSCGEELGASPQLDEVVSAYQSLAWTDWKKRELAKIDVIRVKNVKSVEKVTYRRNGAALEFDACIAEAELGVVSSSTLSEALDQEMTKNAEAALIAARAKRAIPANDGITIELSGMRVIQPTPGAEQDLRPFSQDGGVTIAITVRRGAGGLTSFLSEQSVLRSAVDDKGKDLFAADDPASTTSPGFGSFPTISADGKACVLEVELPGVPTSGARTISLDFDLGFEVASGVNEVTTPITWKSGGHFKVGAIPFEITNYESDDWGTRIDLKTNKSLDDLAGFRFVSAGGEELPVSITSSSRMGDGDDVTEERQITFDQTVQKGKLITRLWKERRVVTVPVKLEVGVGF